MVLEEMFDSWIETMPETYRVGDLIPLVYKIQLKDDNGEYLGRVRNVICHAYTINHGAKIHVCKIIDGEPTHQYMGKVSFEELMKGQDYILLNINHDETYDIDYHQAPTKISVKKPTQPKEIFSQKKNINDIDIKLKDDVDPSILRIKEDIPEYALRTINEENYSEETLLSSYATVVDPRTLFFIHEFQKLISSLPDDIKDAEFKMVGNGGAPRHGYCYFNLTFASLSDILVLVNIISSRSIWRFVVGNYKTYDAIKNNTECNVDQLAMVDDNIFDTFADYLNSMYKDKLYESMWTDKFLEETSLIIGYLDLLTDGIITVEKCMEDRIADGSYPMDANIEVDPDVKELDISYRDGTTFNMKYHKGMEDKIDTIDSYAIEVGIIDHFVNDQIGRIPFTKDKTVRKGTEDGQ